MISGRFSFPLHEQAAPGARRSLSLKSRLPLILLAFLFLVQLFNPGRIWMAVILGLLTMLGTSYLYARALYDGLQANRQMHGAWILVGDLLVETFTVENRSGLPLLWAEVLDHSDLPGYNPAWVASLGGNGRQTHKTEGRCQRRGVFTIGPWEVRAGDPLGLFSVVLQFSDTRSILVYPRAMHLPDLQLPRGDAPGASRISRRTPQFTNSAATVRRYLPGDSLRRIHWLRSAHHDQLMVKEFDLEPSGDLWIILDLDQDVQAGHGAESTLEYGVTLAASLAAQMLAENRRVGLAAFGQEVALLPPQGGELQIWRILEALAHAEAAPQRPLARTLRDLRDSIGRGRTVVVITPSSDSLWPAELLHLERRGNAPAAILLDAASFDGRKAEAERATTDGRDQARREGGPEERLAALRDLLAQQGTPAHIIDHAFIFRPLFQISRTRTELRTLYGTGRVIAVEVEELV